MTFTDSDVKHCRIIIGLMNIAKFELNAKQVIEASASLAWLQNHAKVLNDNVMELIYHKKGETTE